MPLIWTCADDEACPKCKSLDGHEEGDGWEFDSLGMNEVDKWARNAIGFGNLSSPPLHKNCRCKIRYEDKPV